MKRRWILWLLFVVFGVLIATHFSEVQEMAATLAQGQWHWLVLAIALQGLYFVTLTALYQSAFDTVRVRSRLRELLPVTLASSFVSFMTPSAGASNMALFADDAARRGQSAVRASAGTLLVTVANYSAFLLVLTAGLVYLSLQRHFQVYQGLAAGILVLMLGALVGVLSLGLWSPGGLHRLLSWLQRLANGVGRKVKRPDLLPADWADKSAIEFREAAVAITTQPRRLGRTLVVALVMHVVNMASLYVLFIAFHQVVSIGSLVAGFAMGILFWNVSVTPQGIGTVEGAMTLVYTSLGVPAPSATIVSLAFRGLTFWLPVIIGFFLLRRLRLFRTNAPGTTAG
jgi:uncharacterized protein (TIRG00374 family)